MKLGQAWDARGQYSADVSQRSRELGFAVAAICWFFKSENATFPPLIIWSLAGIVVFFVVDVLQYLVGAERQRWWLERQERELQASGRSADRETEIDWPQAVDDPIRYLWYAKLVFLFLAAVFLVSEFLRRL